MTSCVTVIRGVVIVIVVVIKTILIVTILVGQVWPDSWKSWRFCCCMRWLPPLLSVHNYHHHHHHFYGVIDIFYKFCFTKYFRVKYRLQSTFYWVKNGKKKPFKSFKIQVKG